MRNYILMLAGLLMPLMLTAQGQKCLRMPNREMLSSDKVLFLMQDSEGCLWYATEGGGVCRDDGRQIDVFRSDAEQPDLLRSGEVLLTANMKVYRYDRSLALSATYPSQDKYVARLFEDSRGRIWATQWQGGLLRSGGRQTDESM